MKNKVIIYFLITKEILENGPVSNKQDSDKDKDIF